MSERNITRTDISEFAKYVDNTAHQMKTPITVIKTYLELILAELYGPITPETGEKISTIDSNLGEITYFIEQIQDVLMLFCMEEDPELELQDVCRIAKQAAGEMSEYGRFRGIELSMEGFDRSIHLHVNEHCTRRAISNLLRHVMFSNPSGRKISISLEKRNDALDILVGSHEEGISDEDLDAMIGSMFERDAPLTTMDWERLSVPIAKRIMNMQGGELMILTEKGKGSLYKMTFNDLPPEV